MEAKTREISWCWKSDECLPGDNLAVAALQEAAKFHEVPRLVPLLFLFGDGLAIVLATGHHHLPVLRL